MRSLANDAPASLSSARGVRATALLICVAVFLTYVVLTWNWTLVGDSQVMHYVVFLMHHGFAPYRQIGDLNMPGAYMVEGWALAIFGRSDIGWRLWDYTITLLMALGMVSIARRYDWLAGVFGACIFAVVHAADGPSDAAQRDQVIAMLLIVACALLFESVRRQRAWLMFCFAVVSGLATSIKPTVGLAAVFLLFMACVRLYRTGVSLRSYLFAASLGFVAVAADMLLFLTRYRAATSFVRLVTHTIPQYAGLWVNPWSRMLRYSVPPLLAILLLAAVFLAFQAGKQNWEQLSLLLLALSGFVSYLVQHKGFAYHRYLFLAALSLWISIQLSQAFRGPKLAKSIAAFSLVFCSFVLFPRYLLICKGDDIPDTFAVYLDRDLRQLGVQNLQHRVQCLSISDSCMTVLFHEQIVQSTGDTGDLGLFLPNDDAESQRARSQFWASIQNTQPTVYVMSNEQFAAVPRNFNKADVWPLFAKNLSDNYVLTMQRAFPRDRPRIETHDPGPIDSAYRIYIRKGSPLLQAAGQLQP